MILQPGAPMRYPDLMVAFDADPQAYLDSNGYIISDQGKPPDFVLEIASKYSGKIDVTEKRDFYESLQIPEYWRFDATGEFHGVKLAGDRLIGNRFEPILVAESSHSDAESWQGFSEVLGLFLRWSAEELGFIDPSTGEHIATFDSLRLKAEQAEREAEQDRQRLARAANGWRRPKLESKSSRQSCADARLISPTSPSDARSRRSARRPY